MRTILLILCLSLFAVAQNGQPTPAKPTKAAEELKQAERRLEIARATQQRAFILVSQADLADCAKVLAAVAELHKANQQVGFAEEMVELRKKAVAP